MPNAYHGCLRASSIGPRSDQSEEIMRRSGIALVLSLSGGIAMAQALPSSYLAPGAGIGTSSSTGIGTSSPTGIGISSPTGIGTSSPSGIGVVTGTDNVGTGLPGTLGEQQWPQQVPLDMTELRRQSR
jgi:hypothetical protein